MSPLRKWGRGRSTEEDVTSRPGGKEHTPQWVAQHAAGREWAPCWLLCRSCRNREWGWLRRAEGESSSTTLPAWSTSTRSEFRIVLSLCERRLSVGVEDKALKRKLTSRPSRSLQTAPVCLPLPRRFEPLGLLWEESRCPPEDALLRVLIPSLGSEVYVSAVPEESHTCGQWSALSCWQSVCRWFAGAAGLSSGPHLPWPRQCTRSGQYAAGRGRKRGDYNLLTVPHLQLCPETPLQPPSPLPHIPAS